MKSFVGAAVWALCLACAPFGAGCSRSAAQPLATREPVTSRASVRGAVTDADAGSSCPQTVPRSIAGKVASDSIDELSGAVASRRSPGVLWVHNDSGDDARVFAIDLAGRTLAELTLDGADARDIEDIALGRGASDESHVLYVADIGDNLKRRKSVQIYRVEEPVVPRGSAELSFERKAEVLDVTYEDGPHDAETLMVDPVDGDLYLVAKSHMLLRSEPVGVYRVARAALTGKGRVVASKVATIAIGPATAGDIKADGSAIMVRNYLGAMYWPRAPGESVGDAMSKTPCLLPVGDLGRQGESLAFTPDGASYVTIPEGTHAPIVQIGFAR